MILGRNQEDTSGTDKIVDESFFYVMGKIASDILLPLMTFSTETTGDKSHVQSRE